MRPTFLALLLIACGTSTEGTTETKPTADEEKKVDEPEEKEEVEVKEEVGPDGPSHIAVPDVGTPSTDPAVIARGETVFTEKGCPACHAWGSKLVGPDLTGVTERRTPTWIARMITNPDVMTKEDPVARELFKTHMVQMPNQGVPAEDLAPLISFLASKRGS